MVNMTIDKRATQEAEDLKDLLHVEKVSLVPGGPSPSDPEGKAEWYVSFYKEGTSAYIAFDERGHVIEVGGTIAGKRFKTPSCDLLTMK